MKKDPRVDEYVNDCSVDVKAMLTQLRNTIHRLCPGVQETIKWNVPFFLYEEKILCGLGGFKAHCSMGFWNDSYIKIMSKADIPSDAKFKALIKKTLNSQSSKKPKAAAKRVLRKPKG